MTVLPLSATTSCSASSPKPLRAHQRHLIASGGRFDGSGAWNARTAGAPSDRNGEAAFAVDAPSEQHWAGEPAHSVAMREALGAGCCIVGSLELSGCASCGVEIGCSGGESLPELGFETRCTECVGMSGTGFRSKSPGSIRAHLANGTARSARGRRSTSFRAAWRKYAPMRAASTVSRPNATVFSGNSSSKSRICFRRGRKCFTSARATFDASFRN